MKSSFKAIYISLFVATMSAMLGMGIIQPILPLMAHRLGATGILFGMIFSSFALTRGIFAPIFGQYSDSRGRKSMILTGLSFFILLSFCYILANSAWTMMLVRTLQGVASVMVTPIAQAYIGDIIPKGKEGRYMNLFFLSFFGGQAIGPALGGFLSDSLNMNAPFYAMAIMAAIALFLVLFLVPEESAEHSGRKAKRQRLATTYRHLLADRQMQSILLFMSSRGFYRWGFNTFFPVIAYTRIGLSATQIGFILSAYMLIGTIVQYPAGVLSDRFSDYRREIFFYGGLLSPVMMFLVPTTSNFYLLLLITVAMGLFSAISRATAVAVRTERGRIHGMGAVTGAFTTSLSAGQILGPLVFGGIADLFTINDAFYVGGMVGLAGSVTGYLLLGKATEQEIRSSQ
ncbi:MAG: MFS transporter [Desulfopila sp.]